MDRNKLPISKLEDAFRKIGWEKKSSQAGYNIWINPSDPDEWTVIPTDESARDYRYYQEKNLHLLLGIFRLEDSEYNIRDLYSQIIGYNYKLINKIEVSGNDDAIPFEFAQNIPQKTVDAFRSFYNIKSKGKKPLSVDNFRLHHTMKGSFIIPVSIAVKEDPSSQTTLFDMASFVNTTLREYLTVVDRVVKLPTEEKEKFAHRAFEEEIESRVVREFLGSADGVAKYKNKYSEQIKRFTLTSTSSILLDYKLKAQDKIFPVVDLSNLKPVPDEYIKEIEKKEIEADDASIIEHGVNIEVMVEALTSDGTAKFTVLSIAEKESHRPFKAMSVELPKSRLDICTDKFKSREVLTIKGDITKQKGRLGKIVPEDFLVATKAQQTLL